MYRGEIAVPLVHALDRNDPIPPAVWNISEAGALNHPKILGDQLVWGETVFFHVRFTVGAMLGKVPPAYYAKPVAANAAGHQLHAIIFDKSLSKSSKTLSLVREGHKSNIGRRKADFGLSIL